jgi:deoxyadenosine/deoxycytidine kinase
VEKLLENIALRGRSYEKHIRPEYLQEVQEGYFGFFKSQIELKILVIDISGLDFVNKESDFNRLKEVIFEGKFSPGMNLLIL